MNRKKNKMNSISLQASKRQIPKTQFLSLTGRVMTIVSAMAQLSLLMGSLIFDMLYPVFVSINRPGATFLLAAGCLGTSTIILGQVSFLYMPYHFFLLLFVLCIQLNPSLINGNGMRTVFIRTYVTTVMKYFQLHYYHPCHFKQQEILLMIIFVEVVVVLQLQFFFYTLQICGLASEESKKL